MQAKTTNTKMHAANLANLPMNRTKNRTEKVCFVIYFIFNLLPDFQLILKVLKQKQKPRK